MARAALFSSSVLSSAASGNRLPTLQVTLAFVEACGGDREAWKRRWYRISGGGDVPYPGHTAAKIQTMGADHGGSRSLPRPAQLPMRPRGFMGHSASLRELVAETDHPLVVISGPAWAGKSEFALRYAHHLALGKTDGQLYADLRATDCHSALAGFLHAFGVSGAGLPASPHQHAGLYRSLLAERRLVVLLDNVQSEEQIRPLLGETQRSATIVVSGRRLLGLRDARRLTLGAFTREESIAMIAAAVPGLADTEACAELAELCGDLPLALDIVARKLVADPEPNLGELVLRLRDPRYLLGWLRLGDLSLGEALTCAYVALTQPAAALVARLAERPAGEFTLPGDESPVGRDELLAELLEAGMLRRGERPGGYRIEALVRAFLDDRPARQPQRPHPRSARPHRMTPTGPAHRTAPTRSH